MCFNNYKRLCVHYFDCLCIILKMQAFHMIVVGGGIICQKRKKCDEKEVPVSAVLYLFTFHGASTPIYNLK